jgi:hypothetical protein
MVKLTSWGGQVRAEGFRKKMLPKTVGFPPHFVGYFTEHLKSIANCARVPQKHSVLSSQTADHDQTLS